MKTVLPCAIYTRKSSEEGLEQKFNSLHALREACQAYIQSQKEEDWKAAHPLDVRHAAQASATAVGLGRAERIAGAQVTVDSRNITDTPRDADAGFLLVECIESDCELLSAVQWPNVWNPNRES